jgi:hypothetical protein
MDYFKTGRKDGLYDETKKTQEELKCSDEEYSAYLEGYYEGDRIRQGEEMEYEYDEFI